MLRVFETNSFNKGFLPVQQPLVEKTLILQVNTERNNLLYNFLIVFISPGSEKDDYTWFHSSKYNNGGKFRSRTGTQRL